jgi:hypothetical protein
VSSAIPCGACGTEISARAMYCRVCGMQQFPNVNLASTPEEQQALQKRYEEACDAAAAAGLKDLAEQFEAYAAGSSAVMCVKLDELHRLASSDSELKSTYYLIADTRVPPARLPADTNWNEIRENVDTAVFGDEAKRHIRFAALSPATRGLTAYGPCTLVCTTKHIMNRASTFEENTCRFFIDRGGIGIGNRVEVPEGHRSTWADRAKLAVAKLVSRLRPDTKPDQFSDILLTAGATTADDDFVEVHIFGPMSLETFDQVIIDESAAEKYFARPILDDLRKKLFDLDLLKD